MEDKLSSKVVIVEDSGVMRSVLRIMLLEDGFEIVGEYATGLELLLGLTTVNPDVICLDYTLPDTDGLILLREIREYNPQISVVMITGSDSTTLEEKALAGGASGFIRKPFTQGTVIKTLRHVIHAQNLLHATEKPNPVLDNIVSLATAVVADDSLTMRSLLTAILSKLNIEVVGAALDGRQAIDLAVQHKPDFIFLDIEMPVMNGMDALQEITSHPVDAHIFMVTSNSDRNNVVRSIQMGAKGYIVKPYQPEKISDAIVELLF